MADENQLDKDERQARTEWDRARKDYDELRSQYVSSGPFVEGQPMPLPQKRISDGLKGELKQAREKERAAEQHWWDTIQKFPRS